MRVSEEAVQTGNGIRLAPRLSVRRVSVGDRHFVHAVEGGLDAVNARLLAETSFGDDKADMIARYLLRAGGKRVRPLLTLTTAQLGDGTTEAVITVATAVEITHLATLYHDDVMDCGAMRHGVPCAQTVWGNQVAVLIGDLLLSRAERLTGPLGASVNELQSRTFESLCRGQLHEMMGPTENEDPIEHYFQVLADKTGSLIAAAAHVGIIASHADPRFENPVRIFGENLGVAFQLIDDVLDLTAAAGQTGKLAGADLRAGVKTLPFLYLCRLADTDASARRLLHRIERHTASMDETKITTALSELRAHEASRRTLLEARRRTARAVRALEPLPRGPVKAALTHTANALLERSA